MWVISRVGAFCVLRFYLCIHRDGSPLSVYKQHAEAYPAAELQTITFNYHYCCLLFLTFSALVANPKKTTLHGGQSRSWSAEQGEKKKKKSGSAPPPPPPFSISFLPYPRSCLVFCSPGFSRPTPRRPVHLPSPGRIWCLLTGSSPSSRFPRRCCTVLCCTVL